MIKILKLAFKRFLKTLMWLSIIVSMLSSLIASVIIADEVSILLGLVLFMLGLFLGEVLLVKIEKLVEEEVYDQR